MHKLPINDAVAAWTTVSNSKKEQKQKGVSKAAAKLKMFLL